MSHETHPIGKRDQLDWGKALVCLSRAWPEMLLEGIMPLTSEKIKTPQQVATDIEAFLLEGCSGAELCLISK
jgi:hypothetical protein